MRIRYDPSVDAAYIYFKERKVQVAAIRLTEDIAVNFGPNEEVFGTEVLNASEHLGLRQEERSIKLERIKAQGGIQWKSPRRVRTPLEARSASL